MYSHLAAPQNTSALPYPPQRLQPQMSIWQMKFYRWLYHMAMLKRLLLVLTPELGTPRTSRAAHRDRCLNYPLFQYRLSTDIPD